MIEKIWKPIIGYENLYKINNYGEVLSLRSNKILKPNNNGIGYFIIQLCKNGKRKNYLIHRLVAEHFLDNPNNLPEVNHKDEDKSNNFVNNLEWCKHKYNMNYKQLQKRQQISKEYNKLLMIFQFSFEYLIDTFQRFFIISFLADSGAYIM